jgi:hypothetical protein
MILATSQVGISISSKDRWEDLEFTLVKLQEHGFDSLETIVIDDGSIVAWPTYFPEKFPWVKFIRSESSHGYIFQRNQIARLLSAPLILGLDDDSFPVAGSIAEAAAWLMKQPKVSALAFPIISSGKPLPSISEPPFPVKTFIGCGNLIKRELFLALGGYDARLQYSCEEGQFCLDALCHGYATYSFPAVVVEHRVSNSGRNWGPRTRLIVRNQVLQNLWYYPFPTSVFRALRAGPMQIIKNSWRRKFWKDVLIGWITGMFCYLIWPNTKSRLSHRQFQVWENLRSAQAD